MDFGAYFSENVSDSNEADIDDVRMLQFIELYIEESCKIHGNSYRTNPNNSPTQLLNESKIFILYSYTIDILFTIWQALDSKFRRKQALVSLH